MSFCTAINCMDGRTQAPVRNHLRKFFNVQFVDMITETGPNLILAEGENAETIKSIFLRCDISVEKHESVGIAIVGHFDCAGNPSDEETQRAQIEKAVYWVKQRYSGMRVIGLWLDKNFKVHELPETQQGKAARRH